MSIETSKTPPPDQGLSPRQYNWMLRAILFATVISAAALLYLVLTLEDKFDTAQQGLSGYYIRSIVQDSTGSKMLACGERNDTAFIAYSNDSGVTWSKSEMDIACRQMSKVDIDWKSGHGVAIGKRTLLENLRPENVSGDVELLYTNDTGKTWLRVTEITYPDDLGMDWSLPDIKFISIDWRSGLGYCIGIFPTLMRTRDYGKSWSQALDPESPGSPFTGRQYVSGMAFDWSTGYGVIKVFLLPYDQRKGTDPYAEFSVNLIVQTLDSGKTWARYSTNVDASHELFVSRQFSGYFSLMGLTPDGRIGLLDNVKGKYITDVNNGFLEFENFISPASKYGFNGLASDMKEGKGIAIGVDSSTDDGIISEIYFEPALATNKVIVLDTSDALTAVSINPESGHAVVGGSSGGIWVSDTTGHWVRIKQASLVSGSRQVLWYVFGLSALGLIFLLAAALTWRRQILKSKAKPGETVESVLGINPDNPTDQDKLGFAPSTKALVDLIRNPDIRPPVSIVVNGDWGSGKTSLMLQVKKQLEEPVGEKKFITSWFNIWHFENEDQIFNAFITNLSMSLEKEAGLRFRLRILYSKFMKLKWWERFSSGFGLGVVLFLGVFISWVLIGPGVNWVIAQTGNKFQLPLPDVDLSWLNLSDEQWLEKTLWGGGALGGLVIGVLSFSGQYRKSGFSAIRELIPIEKLQIKTNESAPGVREHFQREFREIMKAAKKENASLVVFIDDLDRASGERIKDILGTMNFISDAAANAGNHEEDKFRADIFFIMGMASDIVVNNMNRSMFGESGKIITGQSAENYLEKMVDIVIRVPRPRSELLSLLTSEKSSDNG